MEVHKHKPVHGYKEFLAEVGIIVLGVLIALGAEQTVEALHWAHKVEQSSGPLHDELHDIYVTSVERAQTQACLAKRLDELEARVLAGKGATPSAGGVSPPEAYHTPYRVWGDSVWRSMQAEGLGSHLPQVERLGLSFVYNEAVNTRAENALEWHESARLAVLDRVSVIDPAARADLLATIQSERQSNKIMTIMTGQMLDRIRTSGLLKPIPTEASVNAELADGSATLSWCKALYPKGAA